MYRLRTDKDRIRHFLTKYAKKNNAAAQEVAKGLIQVELCGSPLAGVFGQFACVSRTNCVKHYVVEVVQKFVC